MSQFTTTYTDVANVSATIVQATTPEELSALRHFNIDLFRRHDKLREELRGRMKKIIEIEITEA
jgi:hypothetical protein